MLNFFNKHNSILFRLILICVVILMVLNITYLLIVKKYGLRNEKGPQTNIRNWIINQYFGFQFPYDQIWQENQKLLQNGEKPLFQKFE